jgi:ribonuclease D
MQKQYIDTPDQLADLCQHIRDSPWLALDTEFMRETTYYPRLCLLQLCDGERAACIDPLALEDLTPLLEILYDPNITKVFHAARQDLEIFLHRWQKLPGPVFDTQPAAALLGEGAQIGYGPLVERMLGTTLQKGHTRTDWAQRPLDSQQIEYAFDDVIYLGQVYRKMHQQLTRLGRLNWLQDDMAQLAQPSTYITAPDQAWKKVKGQQSLRGVQYAVLQALAAWRETRAERDNRPRRRVLKDEILIDMARRMPSRIAQLAKIRGIQDRELQRWGETWLALIASANQLPATQWPAPPPVLRLSPLEEAKLDMLMAALRLIADDLGMNVSALASRKDMESLLRNAADARLLQGWQFKVAGERLSALLDGRALLEMRDGEIHLRP